MRTLLAVTALALGPLLGCGSSAPTTATPPATFDAWYLGQTPPGDAPEPFGPGVISGVAGLHAATLTVAPDGQAIFFYSENGDASSYTLLTEWRDGAWTSPARASFAVDRTAVEPFFSPDGQRLYFATLDPARPTHHPELAYVERDGSSWAATTAPVFVGAPVDLAGGEYHPCMVADGTLYYTRASDGAIMRSRFTGGAYQAPEALPSSVNAQLVTGGVSWGDPYLPPDESYLLFKSNRAGGQGGYDLYVSFPTAGGGWSEPVSLGPSVNSGSDEFSADVSPDGKYLFFGRGDTLYWMKADFLQALRPAAAAR